ncbi:DEHA2A08250p [Debaryomyces hansenii CBS767]|uniref:DEHA2A08250p n=1 Tax=Debaryomyces hansenii (strain ATCC 36239 / CBS 767 / BCRC 21394 / JCM 1990 / NBRC 0083 / IGC 2968) TaxID=284592 RepID=B5RSS8_DEBHA|nr:DEHA2A08250p [Debaryomyces hansenii CBS767]CAR65384.1 DEHA2A08250p [Debaryomyces hansenii CBS767]|eukprot:XP_002770007.1 DEHA2A08250p [Debaryomyces hansenii CBS767]
MFSTLDASSFSELNNIKIDPTEDENRVKHRQIQMKNIVSGSRVRSKTGCICCRRRK